MSLDFLALGGLVHRLDPGAVPFRKAHACEIHVSGGEFNCAANLSDCFRMQSGIATAMVDYPIGDLIAGQVRAMGVTPFYKHFRHDGVRGPNMAAVYSDRGYGIRGPVVFYNRAWRSKRQPGSAFKPFLYAAALSHGYSPVSVLEGLSSIAPQGPEEWTPRNAHEGLADALTLRAALIESNNRAAAFLQQKIGSRPVLRLASDVGLRDQPDVPSLSLGTGLVTPLDLTAAYSVFPNGGYSVQPRAIMRVLDADGGVAYDNPGRQDRVISDPVAFQMVSMLEDVMDRGTAAAARATYGVRFPSGGKTGTTDDYKDAWFVGFTSSTVAGVWVGLDQPASIGREGYGARFALPIWSEFIKAAARKRGARDFIPSEEMQEVQLCKVSYLKPVEGCPVYTEYFKEGDDIPTRLCPIHQGTVKQQLRRAVQGFFSGLGKKLRGIFGR